MPVNNELYNRAGDIWWDEGEVLSLLRTALNPTRFGYFRRVMTDRLALDPAGLALLDVGCGGGLLAEEFARLGCLVTGIDPSAPSIATARQHAGRSGLHIDYRVGVGEELPFPDSSFDIVLCCDVLEHVTDLSAVIRESARVLKPGGHYLFDTLNRTVLSNLIVIKVLQEWQSTSLMPPGLHDWHMFIKPKELQALLSSHGLVQEEIRGVTPGRNPLTLISLLRQRKQGRISYTELAHQTDFRESRYTSVLYIGTARRVR
jgi:2-polyprenyl-6-hydroxyphenyl methylase/3-demethylubiquinone-9 3-methyltransferase